MKTNNKQYKDQLHVINQLNRNWLVAYALGYRDGKEDGFDNNPYHGGAESHLYREGYDRGVADYCKEEEQ